MSITRIPLALRESVRQRSRGCCAYCGMPEELVLFPHEVDHVVAEQHGGLTEDGNLCLACLHCNRRKGPNLSSVDPASGEIVQLFHPCRERWHDHFRRDGASIVGITASGRATARLLQLNLLGRVSMRQAALDAGFELF